MQRLRTRGVTVAVPEASNRHMARHFTAGRCADALIPALGLDASTPAAPLNAASSTPSALHSLPPVLLPSQTPSSSHGPFCFLRHRRICKLGGEALWAPPGQQEQTEGSNPVDAWSRRPPAHWGTNAGRGELRHPRDLHDLDPSGSCTRRCSERAVAGGGSNAGFPPRGEHRSGALGGGGRFRPPPPDCGCPGATGGGTPRDEG
jgi:hypothetical protein